jgi:hypothetical protein
MCIHTVNVYTYCLLCLYLYVYVHARSNIMYVRVRKHVHELFCAFIHMKNIHIHKYTDIAASQAQFSSHNFGINWQNCSIRARHVQLRLRIIHTSFVIKFSTRTPARPKERQCKHIYIYIYIYTHTYVFNLCVYKVSYLHTCT